ncbi:NusA-like transcription termination signal-binding factor [Candidatus Micrarchaeota archaeon]|nr:NusA-like transcription termination signal-binding factor [Candidatus Micrarchaeota archaeon]MBI5176954.1 NusA-like transcription termination signal-binding factor [Candidatus Micrarchaeota archaeon]
MPVTLSNEDLQAINLLERSTGARATDVVFGEGSVIFVVAKGDLGRAIGKGGASITKLERAFDKAVEVVEDDGTMQGFLANLFRPVALSEVRESGSPERRTVTVAVNPADKGRAIGRGGERIKKARMLLKRKFGIEDVKIV